jgi:hypothetical protein
MKDNKTLALIGAALLFVGAFMPIISVPIMGSMNYFQNGKGDGVVIVLLAAATAIFAGSGHVKHVLWTGLAAIVVLGFTFIRFHAKMNEARAELDAQMADNPFRGLADAAMNSIQLQWGWAVLLLGAGMAVYAGWQARHGDEAN